MLLGYPIPLDSGTRGPNGLLHLTHWVCANHRLTLLGRAREPVHQAEQTPVHMQLATARAFLMHHSARVVTMPNRCGSGVPAVLIG